MIAALVLAAPAFHRHRVFGAIVLLILLVVIVALVIALVRSRRRNAPVQDTWKPPLEPPKAPDA